jgi:hypothetical protein
MEHAIYQAQDCSQVNGADSRWLRLIANLKSRGRNHPKRGSVFDFTPMGCCALRANEDRQRE